MNLDLESKLENKLEELEWEYKQLSWLRRRVNDQHHKLSWEVFRLKE